MPGNYPMARTLLPVVLPGIPVLQKRPAYNKNITKPTDNARNMATLKILSKKHVNFDQGMDFLIFYQGYQGKFEEHPKKSQEKIRVN